MADFDFNEEMSGSFGELRAEARRVALLDKVKAEDESGGSESEGFDLTDLQQETT